MTKRPKRQPGELSEDQSEEWWDAYAEVARATPGSKEATEGLAKMKAISDKAKK